MSFFDFGKHYKPAYQKRRGKCQCCKQPIVAGSRVMVGTAYYGSHIVSARYHKECFLKELPNAIKQWFFKNDYVPRKTYTTEQQKELNRLRSLLCYYKKKTRKEVGDEMIVLELQARIEKIREDKNK